MNGYIVKGIGGFYYVKTPDGIVECKPRGIFRKQKITPVAGDEVTLETENGAAVIAQIAPRKNVFVRPPVANLDVLFLVASTTQPTPSTLVLDKLSAIAVDKGVQPVIVCTKGDLAEAEFLRAAYERSTLPFIRIDYETGAGLDEVKQWINGRLCAFCGNSGVGKSTLLNAMLGEKVAIVSSKPQTTRTRITGVITRGPLQYVLLDTPGVHKAHNKLGKRMDKTASDSIADVDVSMMLFEPYGALNESEMALVEALHRSGPAIAVINKTDLVKEPADLETRKAELKALGVFDEIYTISVRNKEGSEELFDALSRYAVEGPHYFDDDAYTDMPEKELVAEVIREKALLFMRDEIPHGIAVVVERFKERPGTDLIDIDVNIYCERESHKGMVIGKGGAMLKKIASSARADCEEFLGCRVNLQCWVKVKSDWRDNEFLLNNFGFKQNSSNR